VYSRPPNSEPDASISMTIRPIIAVGPLPPPLNGHTIAFRTVVDALRQQKLLASVVDLSGPGRSTITRLLHYAWTVPVYIIKAAMGRKVVYLTMSQSLRGFVRDWFIVCLGRGFGHVIVCHLHGGNYGEFYSRLPSWIQQTVRKTLRKVDRLIVLSDRFRTLFDFDSILKERICVVHNGLTKPTKPVMGKHLPRGSSEPIRVLYLSNLIESKGYFDVLKAVCILVKRYGMNVQSVFAGEFQRNADDICVRSAADARRRFERIIREQGVEQNVQYVGIVSGEKKATLLREAHFFVLPTNYDAEGEPIAVIEAMAFGNVVIATHYRAIPDLVLEDKTGCFVPFGCPACIAEKIARLALEPERFAEMSQAAVKHYSVNFTGEKYLENVLSILLSYSRSNRANTSVKCAVQSTS